MSTTCNIHGVFHQHCVSSEYICRYIKCIIFDTGLTCLMTCINVDKISESVKFLHLCFQKLLISFMMVKYMMNLALAGDVLLCIIECSVFSISSAAAGSHLR